MKKLTLILIALLVLAPWTLAQTANMQNNTNDNVRMMGGPNVITTDDTATITWKTDDQAATIVRFGTDAKNLGQVEKQSGGARDHKIVLTGLKPGTTYFFAIMTNDGDVRQKGQFTTKGSFVSAGVQNNTNDNVRILGGPDVMTTNDTATITWRTDDQAATIVRFGTDAKDLSQVEKQSGGARDHKIVLTGLRPGTTYHFAIMTNDGDVRQKGLFTTKGVIASATTSVSTASDNVVITMGPELRNFNGSTATLYWETNNVAANDVQYGFDLNSLDQRAYEAGGSRQHTAELTNLQPGRTYFFEILRRNGTTRQIGSFTLPRRIDSAARTNTYAAIPVRMGNGVVVNTGQSGPVQIMSGPMVRSVSDTEAVIDWTTNFPSSSTVRFGQSWLALNQQAQASWGTQHRVVITGLRPNTKYFFRVESAQAENTGQQARSQFGTFQTGAPGESARAPR